MLAERWLLLRLPGLGRRWSGLGLGFLIRFFRSQDGVQCVAFLARTEFHQAFFLDILDQAFQDLAAEVGARHFASAKEYRGFYLIPFFEEAYDVILLGLVV